MGIIITSCGCISSIITGIIVGRSLAVELILYILPTVKGLRH